MYKALYNNPMTAGEPLPFELPKWIATAPFEEYLDMAIEEAENGKALLTMPFRVKHCQGKGLMHGGAITALADTAVAMAIKSMLPEGSHFVTMEMTLKFLAPIHAGPVKAVATAEFHDKRTINGTAEIFDGNGVNAATFTSVFRVKRERR